jgi:hypothetical protein
MLLPQEWQLGVCPAKLSARQCLAALGPGGKTANVKCLTTSLNLRVPDHETARFSPPIGHTGA